MSPLEVLRWGGVIALLIVLACLAAMCIAAAVEQIRDKS